jgi:hypothetical protein
MDSSIVSEQDQRATVRFDASMPVHIDGRPGETHNISAHGVYFECDAQQRPGTLVNFTLEFTLYGQRHRMLCEGKVVRVEENGDRIGVAARLLSPFFVNDDDPDVA